MLFWLFSQNSWTLETDRCFLRHSNELSSFFSSKDASEEPQHGTAGECETPGDPVQPNEVKEAALEQRKTVRNTFRNH